MTLDEFKKQGNFSDEDIAKLIHVTRSTINRWRHGHVRKWPKYIVEQGLDMIALRLQLAAKNLTIDEIMRGS